MTVMTRLALALGLYEPRPMPEARIKPILHIPRGTEISGPIRTQHDVVIEGTVNGSISCPASAVTVLSGGVVRNGSIHAQSLCWAGELGAVQVMVETLIVATEAQTGPEHPEPHIAYQHIQLEPDVQVDARLKYQRFDRNPEVTANAAAAADVLEAELAHRQVS